MKDTLYLLRPDFADAKAGTGTFFCPPCAAVTGMLTYFPKIKESLEVKVLDFPKPRTELFELLGAEHQGCPVLVLAESSPVPAGVLVSTAKNGKRFVSDSTAIGNYLAAVHGVSRPHP